MFDFHLHSSVSFDSDAPAEAIVEAARRAGLTEICFTEHLDYARNIPREELAFTAGTYRTKLDRSFPGDIVVRHGVEVGMTPWNRQITEQDLTEYPYDFVIGSVHFVDDKDIYYPEFWTGTGPEGERRYLEEVLECVCIHDSFDVLGHLTYPAKCPANPSPRPIPCGEYQTLIDELLLTLIRKGKGLEVNTSGYDKIGVPFPHAEYLRRYYDLGGRIITVGSDAHSPDRVGQHIPRALDMVKEIFGYVCTFRERNPVFHKL